MRLGTVELRREVGEIFSASSKKDLPNATGVYASEAQVDAGDILVLLRTLVLVLVSPKCNEEFEFPLPTFQKHTGFSAVMLPYAGVVSVLREGENRERPEGKLLILSLQGREWKTHCSPDPV